MQQNQKGFSLIELIVGIAIIGIVAAGVFHILDSSIKASDYAKKRSYETQQARAAMQRIVDDLREAILIYDPAVGVPNQKTITYDIVVNNLVVQHTIQLGTTPGPQSKTLLRGTEPLTGNIVENIEFFRVDSRTTRITLILNSGDNTSTGNYEIQTQVYSRLAPN